LVCEPLFEVIVSNRARKSLRRLPEYYARRAILAFEALKQNPAPVPEYDVKKLRGLKDTYRIRIGDIRIEYEVAWESKRISILVVEFRSRAYSA
jgi:mRNA interferase RelE/StbE